MGTKMRLKHAFDALLERIRPQELIRRVCVREGSLLHVNAMTYDLDAYERVVLLGSGKAVVPMAEAVRELLGDKIVQSVLVGAYESDGLPEGIRYLQSTHPLPSEKSIEAAQILIDTLTSCGEKDLYIYLLSGGNSALVELPEAGISLEAYQEATRRMLHGGMPIEAINTVRKHLSRVKGGKLAQCTDATGLVLVLCDVLGEDLSSIGSAPFYPDATTFADAIAVLNAYGLFESLDVSIRNHLIEGAALRREETMKYAKANVAHVIIGSNAIVQDTMAELLEADGFSVTRLPRPLQDDVAHVAAQFADLAAQAYHAGMGLTLVGGGEVTVQVAGEGRGGRNQHLALSLLCKMPQDVEYVFLSAATDGIDGNSDAAGALIDTHSRIDAMDRRLDPEHYLQTYDSNTFFSRSGDLLKPGPTHNNLLDVVVLCIQSKPGSHHG